MKRQSCSSCQLAHINGVLCHESGCPEAYRDALEECEECGCPFTPETRHQRYCSVQCYASAHCIPYDDGSDCDRVGGLPPSDAAW